MSAKGLSTLGLRRMREGITHSVCSDIRVQTKWADVAAMGCAEREGSGLMLLVQGLTPIHSSTCFSQLPLRSVRRRWPSPGEHTLTA